MLTFPPLSQYYNFKRNLLFNRLLKINPPPPYPQIPVNPPSPTIFLAVRRTLTLTLTDFGLHQGCKQNKNHNRLLLQKSILLLEQNLWIITHSYLLK